MCERARGERNGRAKLTAEQVLDIHLLARSGRYWQRELGEAFGISQSEVSLIEHRRRWRWLLPDHNEGHQMTGKTKDEEFEERLAASEKRVAELEAKLRGEPPRRQTPEPHKPYDPTANFGMPRSAVQAMAAAVTDRLMADLRSDALKPNPVTGTSQAQLTKGGNDRVQIQRGSGWVDAKPLTSPPGLNYVDQQLDAQHRIDAAERRKLFKE
jgi:hypothetical protein